MRAAGLAALPSGPERGGRGGQAVGRGARDLSQTAAARGGESCHVHDVDINVQGSGDSGFGFKVEVRNDISLRHARGAKTTVLKIVRGVPYSDQALRNRLSSDILEGKTEDKLFFATGDRINVHTHTQNRIA